MFRETNEFDRKKRHVFWNEWYNKNYAKKSAKKTKYKMSCFKQLKIRIKRLLWPRDIL
jgi:hypothetical protein